MAAMFMMYLNGLATNIQPVHFLSREIVVSTNSAMLLDNHRLKVYISVEPIIYELLTYLSSELRNKCSHGLDIHLN